MKVLAVIPSRYASIRLPGKPLIDIAGKPLLSWVIQACLKSKKVSNLIVATDDQRIYDLALSCEVKAKMTESDLPSGSDRVWAVAKDEDCDLVLNIQGDEPLLDPAHLDLLVNCFEKNSNIEMATLACEFNSEDEIRLNNTAKIIMNQSGEALYFSRQPIPYSRVDLSSAEGGFNCLKHIGIYAYKRDFLQKFCEAGSCELEKLEGLEQLRALYLGASIQVEKVNEGGWGVDTKDDLKKVESMLLSRN